MCFCFSEFCSLFVVGFAFSNNYSFHLGFYGYIREQFNFYKANMTVIILYYSCTTMEQTQHFITIDTVFQHILPNGIPNRDRCLYFSSAKALSIFLSFCSLRRPFILCRDISLLMVHFLQFLPGFIYLSSVRICSRQI